MGFILSNPFDITLMDALWYGIKIFMFEILNKTFELSTCLYKRIITILSRYSPEKCIRLDFFSLFIIYFFSSFSKIFINNFSFYRLFLFFPQQHLLKEKVLTYLMTLMFYFYRSCIFLLGISVLLVIHMHLCTIIGKFR